MQCFVAAAVSAAYCIYADGDVVQPGSAVAQIRRQYSPNCCDNVLPVFSNKYFCKLALIVTDPCSVRLHVLKSTCDNHVVICSSVLVILVSLSTVYIIMLYSLIVLYSCNTLHLPYFARLDVSSYPNKLAATRQRRKQ